MNELDELRRESYESSRIYKERLNLFHDKTIIRKTFEPHQKLLLYSSRLHMFPGKLRSRWTGPFVVKVVYPYGAVEIENPKNGKSFKVNGQHLKPFLEHFDHQESSEELVDPLYQDAPSESFLSYLVVYSFLFLSCISSYFIFFSFLFLPPKIIKK